MLCSESTLKCAYSSEPIDSSTSIVALKVMPRSRTSPTSAASSKSSGRMPAISCLPLPRSPRRSRSSDGSGASPIGSLTLSPSSVAGMKFIAGEPMKPATNRLTGSL